MLYSIIFTIIMAFVVEVLIPAQVWMMYKSMVKEFRFEFNSILRFRVIESIIKIILYTIMCWTIYYQYPILAVIVFFILVILNAIILFGIKWADEVDSGDEKSE